MFPDLSADRACEALARVGVRLTADQVRVEWRVDRWAVHLPGSRLAWFAATERSRARLINERRVLRLLEVRCTFQAPRVVAESPEGDFDLRTLVTGTVEPWQAFARTRADPALAARIGASVGAILAQQHTGVRGEDVAGWLPRQPDWPESSAWVRERLPQVMNDRALTVEIEAVMARYEAVPVTESDRTLVHQDVGLHNLALDPETLEVRGLFDYESASWSDRHHDFRYLLFDRDRDEMLDAALAAYEPLVGRTLSRQRVVLYNAASAITFLAYRAGTAPDEKSCGRTLAKDLAWTRQSVARVLALPG